MKFELSEALAMQPPGLTAGVVAALLSLALLAWGCVRCRRRTADVSDDQFWSCDSNLSMPGNPRAPLLADASGSEDGGEWTEAEKAAVADLTSRLVAEGMPVPPDARLLQIAWSRKLDVHAAFEVYRTHVDCAAKLGIREATDGEVRQAYEAMGFCVRAGCDHDGRPLNWVRLSLCEPARMRAAVCVRGTWSAQDALLDSAAANRAGICFVYDALGFGWKNMSADPLWLRTTMLAQPAHPSHISRVWVLDASPIFAMAWGAFKGMLPEHLRNAVIFESTNRSRVIGGGTDEGVARICPRQSLPAYMGGDPRRFREPFVDNMLRGLDGRDLPYRPSPVAP